MPGPKGKFSHNRVSQLSRNCSDVFTVLLCLCGYTVTRSENNHSPLGTIVHPPMTYMEYVGVILSKSVEMTPYTSPHNLDYGSED